MLRRLPMTSGARAARWSGPALRSQRAKNVEKRGEKWGKTHGKSTENHRKRQKTHRKPQKTHRRLIKKPRKTTRFSYRKIHRKPREKNNRKPKVNMMRKTRGFNRGTMFWVPLPCFFLMLILFHREKCCGRPWLKIQVTSWRVSIFKPSEKLMVG